MIARTLLLASALTLGFAALPAQAEVSVSINIGVPPPAVLVEVIPGHRHGYIWAPGYWRWDGHRHHHHWVEGHWMPERAGYHWVPERWEQADHRNYRFEPGRWEREARHVDYTYDRGDRGHGRGYGKKDKHDKHDKHDRRHDSGRNHGDRH